MRISVKKYSSKEVVISLPNALLFSPTLLSILMKFGISHADRKLPDFPPETVRQICTILKEYSRRHGELQLVQVETADGDLITITI